MPPPGPLRRPYRRARDGQVALDDMSCRRECDQVSAPPSVTSTFVESQTFLKKFLARFLLGRQDIEDVAQEAYLRAFMAERREIIDQPKAFLFHIARNLALTTLARKSRQITDYLEEAGVAAVIEKTASPDEEIEAQECFGLYCEAVAALPEKCRQVFLLRKVHGLTHKEIAAHMSLSVSSVEKYLRQGVLACQSYLGNHEAPQGHLKSRRHGSGDR